jgi:hypothetical protein
MKMKTNESTTSASSGSFESGFGGGVIKRGLHPFYNINSKETKPKKKKKKMRNIAISEIEKIIHKALIFEEVYSEKPVEPKGKESGSKNAKSQQTYNSKAAKKTADSKVKSGTEHKKDISQRTKKVSDSLKNNLKNAEVKDVNKDKKVNDDYETEAYQNGMEDIEYERISDEQIQKIKKQIKNDGARKDPSAEKSGKAADKMINQAKKRNNSKDKNILKKIMTLGSDMEFKPESKGETPMKKVAVAENIIKRIVFKEGFISQTDMLNKIPSKYKEDSKVFEMVDYDNKYRIRWEGSKSQGGAVILEHNSVSQTKKNADMFQKIINFDSLERNVNTSEMNESQMFKAFMDIARKNTEA